MHNAVQLLSEIKTNCIHSPLKIYVELHFRADVSQGIRFSMLPKS